MIVILGFSGPLDGVGQRFEPGTIRIAIKPSKGGRRPIRDLSVVQPDPLSWAWTSWR